MSTDAETTRRTRHWGGPALKGLVFLFLLELAAGDLYFSFTLSPALWGFASWHWLPPPVRFALLALPLAMVFDRPREWAGRLLASARETVSRLRVPALVLYLTYIGLGTLFFVLLRTGHVYGDGDRLITIVPHLFGWEPNAPLSIFAHYSLARAFKPVPGATPDLLYRMLSVLVGASYLALVPLLARHAFPDTERRVLLTVALLSFGSLQTFFAYVEHYHTLVAGLVAYLYLSHRQLYGNGSFFWPALLFSATVLWNLSLAFGGPVLAVNLWAALKHRPRPTTPFLFALALLLPPALLLLVHASLGFGPSQVLNEYRLGFHPVYSEHHGFVPWAELLSPARLNFLFNELMLLAPTAPLLVPLAVAHTVTYRRRLTPFTVLLLVMLFCGLLFLFVWKPKLTPPIQDWDLFAYVGVPLTVAGCYLLLDDDLDRNLPHAVVVPCLTYSMLHLVTWVVFSAFHYVELGSG